MTYVGCWSAGSASPGRCSVARPVRDVKASWWWWPGVVHAGFTGSDGEDRLRTDPATVTGYWQTAAPSVWIATSRRIRQRRRTHHDDDDDVAADTFPLNYGRQGLHSAATR